MMYTAMRFSEGAWCKNIINVKEQLLGWLLGATCEPFKECDSKGQFSLYLKWPTES